MRQGASIRLRALALGLVAALLSAAPAAAHPDITMDCHLLFNFEGSAITGLGESWTFDETFSAQLLADYDENNDGTFSEAESGAIRDETFARLSAIHYFTFLTVNGESVPVPEPFGFKAAVANGRVTFSFGLRLPQPLAPKTARIGVEIKDPDYAVGAALAAGEPILLRGEGAESCRAVIASKPADAYFDGLVIPQEVSVACD
ncbi:DUF1007 family protein [Aureimonas sp. AU20]|uniref:DUF1007 family protein n=1 Tax=Aureimonas sp. AU20 TaxID=1349819 RepID=UPI00071FB2B3|nr:DUF1007 family protein [Aureimonas sp. AU20]ALN71807.1 hypothetical protein M673_03720 [Aureimonas sp. AU20]